jgi:hypothetical protein
VLSRRDVLVGGYCVGVVGLRSVRAGEALDNGAGPRRNGGKARAAGKSRARAFRLADQYGATHDFGFPRRRVSVLLFADYAGSDQLEAWIRPLYERYRERIGIYGVAELSIVPGFMHGLVRTVIRKRLDYPVMLDWQGDVARDYAYEKRQANLVVIDTHGRIVLRVVGRVDAAKLAHVTAQLDRLLTRQENGTLRPEAP